MDNKIKRTGNNSSSSNLVIKWQFKVIYKKERMRRGRRAYSCRLLLLLPIAADSSRVELREIERYHYKHVLYDEIKEGSGVCVWRGEGSTLIR